MCQLFCSSLVKNLNEPTQLLPEELRFDGVGGVGGGGERRERKKRKKKLGTTPVTCINIALKNKKI